MSKGAPAELKKVSVSLSFGLGSAEWEADSTQWNAAWALYSELSVLRGIWRFMLMRWLKLLEWAMGNNC